MNELIIPLLRSDRGDNSSNYTARAYRNEDPAYGELIIEVKDKSGERVADIMVTTCHTTGELLVYCTTDKNPDEHTLAIYPERRSDSAVDGPVIGGI